MPTQNPTENVENETGEDFSPVPVKITTTRMITKLPGVFMTPDLVKISTTRQYVNCSHYVSQSRMTWEGCMIYSRSTGEISPVRGIYYVSNSLIEVTSSKKLSRDESEYIDSIVKPILDVVMRQYSEDRILIKYDNYGVTLYAKYIKGRVIEFPLVHSQGHLSIWRVPPPKWGLEAIKREDGKTMYGVYNHSVIEDTGRAELYFLPAVYGGEGMLMRVNDVTDITLSSPDHGEDRITLQRGWYLFTHPRPRRDVD